MFSFYTQLLLPEALLVECGVGRLIVSLGEPGVDLSFGDRVSH